MHDEEGPRQVTPQIFCLSVETHPIRLGLVGSVDLSIYSPPVCSWQNV
jgi:hypothetical protein